MSKTPTVIVGGIGGSGTRLIAMILASLGLNIGNDLNEAYDNLTFTLLFKRQNILEISDNEFNKLIIIYEKSFTDQEFLKDEIILINNLAKDSRPGHPKEWLLKRANNLINKNKDLKLERWPSTNEPKEINELINNYNLLIHNQISKKLPMHLDGYGWKEPNSYIILERLLKYYPNMKYIHLIRNGLDMAFSDNQNQVKLWGKKILQPSDFDDINYASLKYWIIIHKQIIKLKKKLGSNQILILNYDKLCLKPNIYLNKICKFLNISKKTILGLKPLIDPPTASVNKFLLNDLRIFDTKDIDYVKKSGFDMLIDPTVIIGGINSTGGCPPGGKCYSSGYTESIIMGIILLALGLNIGKILNVQLVNIITSILFKRQNILTTNNNDFKILLRINQKNIKIDHANYLSTDEFNMLKMLYKDTDVHLVYSKPEFTDLIQTIIGQKQPDEKNIKLITEIRESFLKKCTINSLPEIKLPGYGWLEPHTYIILDKFYKFYPNMKYIHLVNNGLDYAFNPDVNQNHIRKWAKIYLSKKEFNGTITPYALLKYWCNVNRQVLKIGNKMGPDNFLLLKYDDFIYDLDNVLIKICSFLKISTNYYIPLKEIVKPYLIPSVVSIFKGQNLRQFDPLDIDFVKKLGFSII